MNCYAFDVDHTLEISHGPVRFASLVALRNAGHIVGLCGNWAVVTRYVRNWHHLFSFVGAIGTDKAGFLAQIMQYVPADRYVMVGNDPTDFPDAPPGAISSDRLAAEAAGWEFIRERDFAALQPEPTHAAL